MLINAPARFAETNVKILRLLFPCSWRAMSIAAPTTTECAMGVNEFVDYYRCSLFVRLRRTFDFVHHCWDQRATVEQCSISVRMLKEPIHLFSDSLVKFWCFFSYFPCSHKYINSWMYSNEIENIRHLPQASSKRQNNKLNVDAERILSRCERCVLCDRTRTLISYYDCYEDNAIQFNFFTFLRFILTINRNSSFMEL